MFERIAKWIIIGFSTIVLLHIILSSSCRPYQIKMVERNNQMLDRLCKDRNNH